jgi:hypothetical protein
MKRALIWLTLIPIFVATIFLWLNSKEPAQSAVDFAPEDTWVVFQADDISNLYMDLSDSNSFYRSVPSFTGMTDEVTSFLSPFRDTHVKGSLFVSGTTGFMNYVLVLSADENTSNLSKTHPLTATKQYLVFAQDTAYPALDELGRKSLSSAMTSSAELSVLIKSNALNQILGGSFRADIFNQLSNEYSNVDWLQFDLKNSENIYASGIIKTTKDESERFDATPLLSYLPTETESALLFGTEAQSIGIVSCSYVLEDGFPDHNTFILLQDSGTLERSSDAGLINQEELPEFEGMFFRPEWNDECVRLEMAGVDVYCKNSAQAERFHNDYLAYNRFTDSKAYLELSDAISNASFTLLLRTPHRHTTQAFLKDIDPENRLNALVLQTNTEIPKRKHFAFAALHHKELKDELKAIWTCDLEKPISNGPWPFINHYTQKAEIVVQDKLHQLYLINSDGKILWKRLLDSDIIGSLQPLDVFENEKKQMLFCTNKRLYCVDRNGNDVKGFPVKFDSKINAAPTAIRYSAGSDLRILVSAGNVIKNIDQNGEEVDGWDELEIGAISAPIEWHSISGKDYLLGIVDNQTIEILDRAGKRRRDPKTLQAVNSPVFIKPSESIEKFSFIYSDSAGNLVQENLKGSKSVEALIPIDSGMRLLYNSKTSIPFGFTVNNRLVSFNRDLDVVMDYLFPFEIGHRSGWANQDQNWLSVFDQGNETFYLFDTESGALDKMPISGGQHAIVIDLDKNDVLKVVVGNKLGEFTAYQLSY